MELEKRVADATFPGVPLPTSASGVMMVRFTTDLAYTLGTRTEDGCLMKIDARSIETPLPDGTYNLVIVRHEHDNLIDQMTGKVHDE